MRKLMLLVFFMSMIVSSSSAESDYRLRVPDVKEYLTTVATLGETGINDTYLTLALYNTLFWRYPDFHQTANFDLLRNASLVFRDHYSLGLSIFLDELTQVEWNEWLIWAWLRENPQAFDESDEILFSNFRIAIQRVDLSGDGSEELLLDVREIKEELSSGYQFFNYVGYWVLQPTSEGYRRVSSPLSWYSDIGYGGSDGRTGVVHTLKIDDVNADGLIEWVVLEGSYFHRGYGECRQMRVLGWRDDSLVDLIDGDLRYCTATSSMMEEISPNAEYTLTETEIVQKQNRFDSWWCFWEETTVFTWTGTHYIHQTTQQNFEDTLNCTLRHAEEAMRSGDFEKAIVAYEKALLLPDTLYETVPENEQYLDWQRRLNAEHRQYARLRLAIAYALTDRWEMTLELLHELRSEQPASLLIQRLLGVLDQVGTSAELCMAVHDVFADFQADPDVWGQWNTFTDMFIRETIEDIRLNADNFPPDPSRAGCDPIYVQDVEVLAEAPPETTDDAEIVTHLPFMTDRGNFSCGTTGDLFCGFYESDHAHALEMIEALSPEDFEQEIESSWGNFQLAVRYRRALALESLGRTDEALAEYIVLYEAAPESAWGMLAGLHLEVGDGE